MEHFGEKDLGILEYFDKKDLGILEFLISFAELKYTKKMSYPVSDIANKLLHRAYVDEGSELMSNMKLQKMLYYEQGFHLAYFGTPLFDAEIVAWQYGPVVPEIYNLYKCNGRNGIVPKSDPIILEQLEENLFNEVFEVYNEYSASGLVTQTHSEKPWQETSLNGVISNESMQSFFADRLE